MLPILFTHFGFILDMQKWLTSYEAIMQRHLCFLRLHSVNWGIKSSGLLQGRKEGQYESSADIGVKNSILANRSGNRLGIFRLQINLKFTNSAGERDYVAGSASRHTPFATLVHRREGIWKSNSWASLRQPAKQWLPPGYMPVRPKSPSVICRGSTSHGASPHQLRRCFDSAET